MKFIIEILATILLFIEFVLFLTLGLYASIKGKPKWIIKYNAVFWIGIIICLILDKILNISREPFIISLFVNTLILISYFHSDTEINEEQSTNPNSYIQKIITGDRNWFHQEITNNLSNIPLNTLVSIEFEPIDRSYFRPVGSLVTINKDFLNEHVSLIKDNIINRDKNLRKTIDIPFFDSVKHIGYSDSSGRFHNLWNRTHTITFRFSLDEGETKGLTFAGTSYANGGDRVINNRKISISKEEHSLIANNLMDILLKNYKQENREDLNYSSDKKLKILLYNNFTKFNINDLRNNFITFVNESDKEAYEDINNFQLSMNDYEILAERVINYFQKDDFIYSTELIYTESQPLIPNEIRIKLFNKTQNHISFWANIKNVES